MCVGVSLAAPHPEAKADPKADPQIYYNGLGSVYGHGGNGYPYGNNLIEKRSSDAEPEAEAKADPQLLNSGLHGYPYEGYGYHFDGKRSNDAEPAMSKPYGGYYGGYPYPFSFGK